MGKKLQATTRWKRYLRRRQDAEMAAAHRRNRRSFPPSRPSSTVPQWSPIPPKYVPRPPRHVEFPPRRPTRPVAAPQIFSLLQNPEGVIAFLNQIESLAPDHNLSIDLARVTTITTDAIVAMLATMQRHKTDVRGNLPRDNAAREILVQSGFFQDVKQTQALPQVVQGLIFREQNKKVQPDAAKLLIRKGTEIISGSPRRCPPAFRVLIESMVNTHNHASGFPGSLEPWWAMVYGDVARKRSCFTFVDTGVGIFRTLQVGLLRRIYQIFGKDDTEILREMLRGEVQSSTGLPYRGKGLPAIYEHQVKGRIKSLTIIANRVFADVAANDFRPLKNEFHGTLLYWEIE